MLGFRLLLALAVLGASWGCESDDSCGDGYVGTYSEYEAECTRYYEKQGQCSSRPGASAAMLSLCGGEGCLVQRSVQQFSCVSYSSCDDFNQCSLDITNGKSPSVPGDDGGDGAYCRFEVKYITRWSGGIDQGTWEEDCVAGACPTGSTSCYSGTCTELLVKNARAVSTCD